MEKQLAQMHREHDPAQERARMRIAYFIVLNLVFLCLFFGPLRELADLAWYSGIYSYIPLIPIVSAFLVFVHRKRIFSESCFSHKLGVPVTATSAVLCLLTFVCCTGVNQNDYLSMTMAATVLWLFGTFLWFFGARAFREARHPCDVLVEPRRPPSIPRLRGPAPLRFA